MEAIATQRNLSSIYMGSVACDEGEGLVGGTVLERTRKDQWTFMPWSRLKEVSLGKTTSKNQKETALLLRLQVRRQIFMRVAAAVELFKTGCWDWFDM